MLIPFQLLQLSTLFLLSHGLLYAAVPFFGSSIHAFSLSLCLTLPLSSYFIGSVVSCLKAAGLCSFRSCDPECITRLMSVRNVYQ